MKIYFIGQKGIPSHSGGVEKHVEDLASHLVYCSHEVYVYTRFNYTPRKLKQFKGVRLIGLPSVPTKHLDAITHTFFACLHVIFRRKVDVVHFHSIGPCFWMWLVKLFKPNTLVVATFHSQCYRHKKWGKLAKICLKLGELSCVKFADKIIAVSKNLKEYVKDEYNKDAYYIPNGVLPATLMPVKEIEGKWNLKGGDYILSVCRLVRHKGVHYLIEAFKRLDTKKKLVIVGDGVHTGDYVSELKEIAGDDPRIVFTGSQTGNVLKEFYTNAFAFVQPSEAEGLSIALLEAMSYNLPVIASNIKENREVLGDSGIYFESENSKDLSQKLDKILKEPNSVQESVVKNSSAVSSEYDWHNISKQVLQLYFE